MLEHCLVESVAHMPCTAMSVVSPVGLFSTTEPRAGRVVGRIGVRIARVLDLDRHHHAPRPLLIRREDVRRLPVEREHAADRQGRAGHLGLDRDHLPRLRSVQVDVEAPVVDRLLTRVLHVEVDVPRLVRVERVGADLANHRFGPHLDAVDRLGRRCGGAVEDVDPADRLPAPTRRRTSCRARC